MYLSADDRMRFLNRIEVDQATGCWEWQAGRNKDGYGRMKVGSRDELAHRVSYTIYKGPIPHGKIACHSCDNTGCVNPEHLWLGSNEDNTQDMMKKGRHRSAGSLGSRNPRSVLSEADAIEVLELIDQGLTNKAIAAKFSVTHSTISCIRRGKSWKHLPRKAAA
ncbi:HNH endonuclease [Halomonas sp. hl-4]|nr:HNH endonuclease [Halomonas sp. hl-4]